MPHPSRQAVRNVQPPGTPDTYPCQRGRGGTARLVIPGDETKNGAPLGHRNVTRRGFEPAALKAGIEGVSFHDMRHAFASRMIDRGISSTVLAKLMGHESSAITEKRYIHLFDQRRTDDAVRAAMGAASS